MKSDGNRTGGTTHEYQRRHPPPRFVKTRNSSSKKQTAREVIAANVQTLIEQLEQGQSESLMAYLRAMGRFHNYSFGNIFGDCAAEVGRDPRC